MKPPFGSSGTLGARGGGLPTIPNGLVVLLAGVLGAAGCGGQERPGSAPGGAPAPPSAASSASPPPSATVPRALPAERDGMVLVPGGRLLPDRTGLGGKRGGAVIPPRGIEVRPFWIDRTEVTVADYVRCVEAGKCSVPVSEAEGCNWRKPYRENHPINCMDFAQAVAYCAWKGGRLPTEAEWDLAARGTDGRQFPWGDNPPTCDLARLPSCGRGTAPVGSRPEGASPYGLLDMVGNVWEWVADDLRDEDRPAAGSPPGAPASPGGAARPNAGNLGILWGGSWYWVDPEVGYRVSARRSARSEDHGFRCVKDVRS